MRTSLNERIEYMKSRNAERLIGHQIVVESRIRPGVGDNISLTSRETDRSQDLELQVPLSYRIWSWLKTHVPPILWDE